MIHLDLRWDKYNLMIILFILVDNALKMRVDYYLRVWLATLTSYGNWSYSSGILYVRRMLNLYFLCKIVCLRNHPHKTVSFA